MATYQENIPSQGSFQFQPNQRNNQAVMGALSARTGYFLQSAEKLKNSYDSTFNIDLSNQTNIENLQKDKEDADKKLSGVLKSDLSISDNQTRFLNILKPVYTNHNYLYDEDITSSIKKGIGQAQSDVKKYGADHYNSLSVQAMNNTLNRWRQDDPNNYEGYIDDTLGTTYQPYDPKVDKDYYNQLSTYVKNGIVTNDIPDGHGNILVRKGSSTNSTEMQEWIRSTMPEQMKTQKTLEARLYIDNFQSNLTPQGKQQATDYFNNLATNNILKQQSYISTQKQKLDYKYGTMTKEEQGSDEGKLLKSTIDKYQGYIDDTKDMYKDFDQEAYTDPLKRNLATNQAQSLLLGQFTNGIVDGLGLDNTSETVKSDQAFWERARLNQNEDHFQKVQAFKMLQLAAKNKGKNADGTDINPNVFTSNAVSDTGGVNSPSVDNTTIGENKLTAIQGEPKLLQDENISRLFGSDGLKVVVNNPSIGTSDIYTALSTLAKDPSTVTSKAYDVIDKIVGGNQDTKDMMKALLAKGYQLEGNKDISDRNMSRMTVVQATRYLRNVSSDQVAFNDILSKYHADSNDLENAAKIGFNNSLVKVTNESNKAKYGSIFTSAAKQYGLNELLNPNVPFTTIADYSGMDVANNRKNILKQHGYNDTQIIAIGKYINNGDASLLSDAGISTEGGAMTKLAAAGNAMEGSGLSYDPTGTAYQPSSSSDPIIENLRKSYAGFHNAVVQGLAGKEGPASNYNALSLAVTDNPHKGMDNSEFLRNDLIGILQNKVSGFDENGNAIDHKFTDNLNKFLAAGGADDISNVSPHTNGNNSYLTLTFGKEFLSNQKKMKDAGVDEDFLNNLPNIKIPVDNSVPEVNFRMGKTSTEKINLLGGRQYGADLASGNTFRFYNVGQGNDLNLAFDGSFNMVSLDPDNSGFTLTNHVLNKSTLDDMRGANGGKAILPPSDEIIALQPNDIAQDLYKYDLDSKRVSDILTQAGIDITKHIKWSDIPLNIRQKLIKASPNFVGFPTN